SQVTGISRPASATTVAGESTSLQVQAQFTDGSSQAVASSLVTFTSSNPTIATVDGLGNVTGISVGSVNITATYGNPGSQFTATTAVTVSAATLSAVTVIAEAGLNVVGVPIQLHIIGIYSDGSTQDLTNQAQMSSSNPIVAVVNSSGTVSPKAAGIAQISASLDGVVGTLTLTIGNAVLTAIS